MPSYFEARRVNPEIYKNYTLPKFLEKELPEKKDAFILDIGCGLGQTLKCLKKMSYTNIYGLDIDPQAVKYCKEEGLSVSLIKDLISHLENSKQQFDFIIMQHLIEHLKKEDIIPVLTLIYKNTLKDGGKIIISTPNAQSVIGVYWAFEDFTHNYIFTTGSLYYVLYMSGFRDIKFLDLEGVSETRTLVKKQIRLICYKVYALFDTIKNKLMGNIYHIPSETTYSWQLKVIAKKL